jgi:hypothetical protein
MIYPDGLGEWLAFLSVLFTLITAAVSAAWSVLVRSRENSRAEWRRLEELVQIVHHGTDRGIWAQKLAVDEMLSLRRRKPQVQEVLRDAARHFRATGEPGLRLSDHIDKRLSLMTKPSSNRAQAVPDSGAR